jgi:hypothetical protein
MKIMRILVLLVATSAIVHAQQAPAPALQQPLPHDVSRRPITKESECFCKSFVACCGVSLFTCCLYSALLASNESRAKTQIETLQTTQVGQLVISELQSVAYQKGLNDGQTKGLIAGQTMCPKYSPEAMLRDDAYQPCVCLDWSIKRVKKDQ